ncbi:DUF955 domain-containing protein [Halobaculum sp. WSA2]|uniref:DUF955 domain-containing protein n=1 Tax=Halobaculum saliterrae TaxID=2073113 RepID=A0A6B0SQL4_9EURY|nr:DUF955 domain-containing protein [Halobaculum saliterrae]MXR40797.1 DUF955 domain-containing protein [Halobaculum saliterrae]
MMASSDPTVSFDETDSRRDEMHSAIDQWIDDLVTATEDARASEAFQAWLDVQSRFHDYSARNTMLITQQQPDARRVAGYRAWQEEFDRQVQEGASAIWIWAPIITTRCPECENAPSYHADSDCEYDATPPEEWDEGVVGFRPVPVFDISQTEGEPLPELDHEATGEAGDLVERLIDAASQLGASVEIVADGAWEHGDANGICRPARGPGETPVIEVRDRSNRADLARTLVHEYAHAQLHVGVDDETERAKREVEAEAVAYVVARACGVDASGSAFYLASWAGDDTTVIRERLERISSTAETIHTAIDEAYPCRDSPHDT